MAISKIDNSDLIEAVETLRSRRVIKRDHDIVEATGFSQPVISNYLRNKVAASKNFRRIFFEVYGKHLKEEKKYNIAEPELKYGRANAAPLSLIEKQIIAVPLVSQRAYAGYLSGFSDPEYIEDLPKEPFFMDREYKGRYVAFEVRGDSMDDGTRDSICERDIVLGREIIRDHWKNKLHIHKWNFVIVTKDDGILYKQIKAHDTARGIIVIHSLNPLYEDREIRLTDVAQLFNVVQVNRKM